MVAKFERNVNIGLQNQFSETSFRSDGKISYPTYPNPPSWRSIQSRRACCFFLPRFFPVSTFDNCSLVETRPVRNGYSHAVGTAWLQLVYISRDSMPRMRYDDLLGIHNEGGFSWRDRGKRWRSLIVLAFGSGLSVFFVDGDLWANGQQPLVYSSRSNSSCDCHVYLHY